LPAFSHDSETLHAAFNLIETPDAGVIVAGGPSSSELLNDFRERLIHDAVELDRHIQDARSQINQANAVFQTQLTALSSYYSSLNARLPAVSGHFLADFFTSDFIDNSNTAAYDTTYGQATLPILSSQEKLVGEDAQGNIWIPQGAQVEYSYATGTPTEVQWLIDDNSRLALDQRSDTAWWRNRETSGTVWVRVKLPVNLNANKLANAIILHPYPTLSFDLLSVEYKSPAGVYSSADLSYLQGWSSSLSRVQQVGNVRIWTPQSQITELRLKISTQSLFGFSKISVRQIDFQPAATLAINFSSYNTPLLGSATVVGKDQAALSYLTKTINGQGVSVALVQSTAGSSPIITGISAQL
jgi:hypothetical protein